MSRDALVVGINQYPYISHLKTPAFDAEAIAISVTVLLLRTKRANKSSLFERAIAG